MNPDRDPVQAARVRALACAIERAREALASVARELRQMAGDLPAPEVPDKAGPGALPLAGEAPEVSGDGERPEAGEPGDRAAEVTP